LKILSEATKAGNAPIRARSGAAAALGKLASYQDKKEKENTQEILEQLLLRDSFGRMNTAAARGLGALRESRALGSLETYRRRIAEQDRPELDRIMKSLREGGDSKISSLEKELEEIRSKYRKLEERIFALETKSGESK
jgi:hypothetical protein